MMKTLLSAIFLVIVTVLDQGLSVKEYYVHPYGNTYKCRYSGKSPCHELKFYAKNSMFQSNRKFFFFQGNFHLDRKVNIKNVDNLSLVGESSSGVNIHCLSQSSGFLVEKFTRLSIENMTTYNQPPRI